MAIVLSASAAVAYENEVKTISSALADQIARAGKKSIAVVDFTDLQGNVTELGRFLAEEFSVRLAGAGKGFEVIDRNNLKTILQEHKLQTSGIVDPATAKKLGEIVGVDALVTGNLTAFGDMVHVSVKVLDTATAKIIGATSGDIPKTKAIEDLLSRGISGGVVSPTGSVASATAAATPRFPQVEATRPTAPTYQNDSYRVTVVSGRKSGNTVTLTLVFESLSEREFYLAWGWPFRQETVPSLLDENGERWALQDYDSAGIVARSGYGAAKLVPGTRLRTSMTFVGRGSGSQFTLVCTENAPKAEREVIIRGIAAYDLTNPRDPAAAYDEAMRYYDRNDMARARALLEKTLEIDPNYPDALFHLGIIYLGAGDGAKAKELLQKFLQVAPDHKDAAAAREMLKYL